MPQFAASFSNTVLETFPRLHAQLYFLFLKTSLLKSIFRFTPKFRDGTQISHIAPPPHLLSVLLINTTHQNVASLTKDELDTELQNHPKCTDALSSFHAPSGFQG